MNGGNLLLLLVSHVECIQEILLLLLGGIGVGEGGLQGGRQLAGSGFLGTKPVLALQYGQQVVVACCRRKAWLLAWPGDAASRCALHGEQRR